MSVTASEDVPDFAMLWLPPFPHTSKTIIPYGQWQQGGIYLPPTPEYTTATSLASHDAGGRNLVDMAQNHTPESRAARGFVRQRRRLAEGGSLVRLPLEDCFKIGEQASTWIEPYGTANEGQFDISVAPFDRLMTATRDFVYTRNEAFQFQRNHRLFNLMRESFGLRAGGSKSHWLSVPTQLVPEGNEREGTMSADEAAQESCCLLRDTENSVRGFLALVRREAEAGWDIDPPVQLAKIAAAFFAYIVHHGVFPEEPLKYRFETAAALARVSPKMLLDAYRVESVLADGRGWNRANWAAWGGQYGGAERGGLEREIPQWPVASPFDESCEAVSNGDWKVEIVGDTRPLPPAKDDALRAVSSLLGSTTSDEVRLLGHLPYARRRVTHVIPPATSSPPEDSTSDRASMYQLVTVPAPWMPSEAWRRNPATGRSKNDTGIEASRASSPNDELSGPLEREHETVPDPELMTIWIEASAVGTDQTGQSLIGMALRGRWGLFGTTLEDEVNQWWAFKAKDYVLPALWAKS